MEAFCSSCLRRSDADGRAMGGAGAAGRGVPAARARRRRRICGGRSRRSSGGMRTAPSGAPCRPSWALVEGGADLHPLGASGRLGAPARPGAGARRPTRHGVSRRHQRPRAPEGGRGAPKRGSQAQRDAREALGRSRGGYGTKACVIADGAGRAIAFALRPVRRTNCRTPFRCSTACPACPAGWWPTAAIPATPSASTSGTWAPGRRSRPSATRRRSPARTGSTTTATSSSGSGPGSRSGGPSQPATRRPPRSFMGVLCLAATLDWLKTLTGPS